jgi:hypothetical protein
MLISHRHKFIFVHVQKSAGESIEAALRPFCDAADLADLQSTGLHSHATAEQIIGAIGRRRWDSYFKFALERNPWDKCVSIYYYQREHWSRYWKWWRPAPKSFQDWFYPYFGLWTKKLTPSHWLYTLNGQVAVDYLGRYESLADNFDEICRRIGLGKVELPVVNRSRLRTTPDGLRQRDYREHYTSDICKRVGEIYHREVELLGYSF